MDLFGNLPGFTGGPSAPAPTVPTGPTAPPAPPAPAYEDDKPTGDIRDRTELPAARPGTPRTLWGHPERAAALWGPITAADPVIGADGTATGLARIETETTYREFEIVATSEHSTSITIEIESRHDR